MRFANPAGLWLLSLWVPIVLLHVLRPRRRAVEVSSTFLWRHVPRTVSAASPWQKLRLTPLLLLQLLIVALLALAVARPVQVTSAPLAQHTVFVIDASGSMEATDASPTRLEAAKDRARSLRGQLPAGGLASVVVASTGPRVVLSASPDQAAFDDALDRIERAGGDADFATAFTLAESLETPGSPIGFVLLSDGGLEADERRLLPPGTRYERVGTDGANIAVSRLDVEARGSGTHARVTLRNTGAEQTRRRLVLSVDGDEAHRTSVAVPPGESLTRSYDLPRGDRVVASLDGDDRLPSDDAAFAVAAQRRELQVLVATPGNPFLIRLLEAIPGTSVEVTSDPRPAPGADLAVYDRVAVPDDVGTAFWAIAPPDGAPGVEVTGTVERPVVTLVEADDDLVRGVDLSDVTIASAQAIRAPGDEVLVAAPQTPLLIRGTREARPFVYLSFGLADSDLPLQVAFPVLGDRLVGELTGSAAPATDLQVGEPLPVETRAELTVSAPGADGFTVSAGAAAPVADSAGFWAVSSPGQPTRLFAVNPAPGESDITPAPSLPVRVRPPVPGEAPPRGEAPLLPWVLATVAVVAVAELALSRRTSGVSRRQWRWAMVVRGTIALLLVGALVGFALPRSGEDVAVVFLVDASESMGPIGRSAAVEWTAEALERMPGSDRAAVAFFGGDARLEMTLQERARLREQAVQIDSSRTNLAGALRLGAAVLPSDARRRLVVVSDGRITHGDAASEVQRLRDEGIRVDVHPITDAGTADAAVSAIEVPSLVRQGEAFGVQVRVASTSPGPVRLTVTRDGEVVHESVVDVDGEAVVDVPQHAGGPGVVRYRAQVSAQSDGVPENDEAFAAVRVEGPARVLVAEGRPGEASAISDALRAGGVEVDVVAAGSLPPLEDLSGYAATVLVNVEVPDLSAQQVDVLAAATRDLGRGLVVVGGDRAYGLGGYLESTLEELLPVISDIRDPKRRQPVAQVLVIDASGSMAEPASGAGGAQKIDVARTGAARAVSVLKPEDEVGVLAFNTDHSWILELQPVPDDAEVRDALGSLLASGGTMIAGPLQEAGRALDRSDATRKHVILFSDGISGEPNLQSLAAELADRGITVSAVGTGAALDGPVMEGIANAGEGRFYAARDSSKIPEILTQEAVIASRNFVNEGEFLPTVTSGAAPVRSLTSAPPLLGYVATTAKPAASTLMTLGEHDDPLLASWRVGLGRATAWTSDASSRWAQLWAGWDGYPDFWSSVVKDAFPLGGASGAAVRARVDGDRLLVTVDGEEPWPDGATARARATAPDLGGSILRLERTGPNTFAGELPAAQAGSYAVGATVDVGGATVFSGTAIASRSYSAEYRPGDADPRTLERLSRQSGGRGSVDVTGAFDPTGLVPGRGRIPLAGWFLLAAALLWPADVALRRLALHGAGTEAVRRMRRRTGRLPSRLAGAVRRRVPKPGAEPSRPAGIEDEPPAPQEQAEPEPPKTPATLQRLLERKRGSDA